MRRETLDLAPFLDALERRLDALTTPQLQQVLLEHAQALPAAERGGFLAIFEAGSTAPASDDGSDPVLVEDVAAFLDEVASGSYAEGDGFNAEYGDYRTFGSETWTIEFDGLLEGAGRALLAGDAAVAREAYAALLDALDGGYEGCFPGAGTAAEMISSDLGEAKHLYLRAVWETEPLATRAAGARSPARGVAGRAHTRPAAVTRRRGDHAGQPRRSAGHRGRSSARRPTGGRGRAGGRAAAPRPPRR